MPRKPGEPLFLDPLGRIPDFRFGVLRARYDGRSNTVTDYVSRKTRLCARSEVLLPPGAPDLVASHAELWRSYEAARLPDQRDLAICLTLYLPRAQTLHGAWEMVRAYGRGEFACARALPATAVLHAPGLGGSKHDVHAHLIISAREFSSWGWAKFTDLCRDSAQAELHASWSAHREAWTEA